MWHFLENHGPVGHFSTLKTIVRASTQDGLRRSDLPIFSCWTWNFCTKNWCLLQGACREMSSSAITAEKCEVHSSELLLLMLCCECAQPRLLSAICIHLAYRSDVMTSAHLPTCALQQTSFLGQINQLCSVTEIPSSCCGVLIQKWI